MDQIDRQSAIGKRDYAMVLVTARLGLRVGDLRRLELGWFDWRAKTLGYAAAGPLSARVGDTEVLMLAAGCVCIAVAAALLVPRVRSLRQTGTAPCTAGPS